MADYRIEALTEATWPAFQALVERGHDLLGDRDGIGRAGDGQLVATRHHGDAELLLDACQMLVVLAEELRQQPVVFELQMKGCGDRGEGSGTHAIALSGSNIAAGPAASVPPKV